MSPAGQHEQIGTGDVGEIDQQLPRSDRQIVGHHVEAQYPSPRPVAAPFVEPALDRGCQTGDAEAVYEAQEQPGSRREGERIGERGGCGDRCEDGKSADVPDPQDNLFSVNTAERQPRVVRSHDDADQPDRITGGFHAQRQGNAEQAVADDERRATTQQRPYGGKNLPHIDCQRRYPCTQCARTGRPSDKKPACWNAAEQRAMQIRSGRLLEPWRIQPCAA